VRAEEKRDDAAALPPLPDASGRGAFNGAGDLPAHVPATYYDRPLLKKPHWEGEVIAYLFLGGIMGGSGILAMLCDDHPEHDEELARIVRYSAFVLAPASPGILLLHLGRPERFLHMLRIFKLKSVMSMGVWGLIGFSIPATLAASAQAARDGILSPWLDALVPRRVTDVLLGFLGAFIVGYTGVLLSATAIPVWAIGKRYIPAFCVCSGVAGACALNAAVLALSSNNERSQRKLERLELLAGAAEFVLLEAFRRHAGPIGEPMFGGKRGAKLRTVTQILGIVAPAALNLLPFGGRAKTLLTSVLTLAGGYVLRETLIEGGKASADDPRAASRQPE
jgi:formate-dependent nitrite reductase membrane component NrfD